MKNRYMTKGCCLVIIIFLLTASCNGRRDISRSSASPGKGEMADLNRYMVRKDRERIQNYIERKNLNMTETSTGLWYQILKEGTGDRFRERDRILMEYECSLLDGTPCYSSSRQGPQVNCSRTNRTGGRPERRTETAQTRCTGHLYNSSFPWIWTGG